LLVALDHDWRHVERADHPELLPHCSDVGAERSHASPTQLEVALERVEEIGHGEAPLVRSGVPVAVGFDLCIEPMQRHRHG